MSSKQKQLQNIIRRYKDETGKKELDMREVAKWAIQIGCELPKPVDPIDLFARSLSRAARSDYRTDKATGKPYRSYHAVSTVQGDRQLNFWVDIDEAPRNHMHKSLFKRREGVVDDCLQMTLDLDHWNRMNPKEEPIVMPLDFTEDVEERKSAPEEEEDAI